MICSTSFFALGRAKAILVDQLLFGAALLVFEVQLFRFALGNVAVQVTHPLLGQVQGSSVSKSEQKPVSQALGAVRHRVATRAATLEAVVWCAEAANPLVPARRVGLPLGGYPVS